MADYSKFKNANGDDLVLQDKELRDNVGFDSFTENEKILAGNINHNTAGIILVHNGKIINANESSGGLYYDESRQGIFVNVDGETIIEDYKCLSVANPVPDTYQASDGDVLTYDGNTDEIVWAAPQPCKIPKYTQADAGKVLAVKSDGSGLEWISLAPANAVSVNNEPVGVNGDYFTVGEGQ